MDINSIGYGLSLPPFAAAAAAPVVPWDTVTPAAICWWDASEMFWLMDGDPVTIWADKTMNGGNLDAYPTYPTYRTAVLNGAGVVEFPGSTSMAGTVYGAGAQPATIYLVGKCLSGSTSYFLDGTSSKHRRALLRASRWAITGGTLLSDTVAPTPDTAWHIHTSIFNGANSQHRLDDLDPTTGNAGTQSESSIVVGSSYLRTSGFLTGQIADIIYFAGAHDAATQNSVIAYLKTKWGL